MSEIKSFQGRTCFIVAPIDQDLSPVIGSLTRMGIGYQHADWFDLKISPISLRNAMRRCDFVCVFSSTPPPTNLWFEVGLAIGLGKPIFLVADQDFMRSSLVRHMSYVFSREWKPEVVEPHLEAFLETIPLRRPPVTAESRRMSKRTDLADERLAAERLAMAGDARAFEDLVARAFQKAGFSVTSAPLEDFGADIAVWSPEISRQFGDPILVEVKGSARLADHRWGVQKLSDLITPGRASLGIYVTLEPVETTGLSPGQKAAPVLMVTLKQLIDLLASGTLIDSLWSTRNQIRGRGL